MTPTKIGILGCGNISSIYFKTAQTFDILDVAACADLDITRAEAKATEHGIAKACTPEALLSDPDIEIIVNLTIPLAHYSTCRAALEAGKHVYVEKPLSVTRAQGQELVTLAHAKNLRLGGAPDTFLGASLQTCRQVIDDGLIGEIVGFTAFMMGRGHERWHPDPEFFYQPGGGPMFDMGPYYVTALVALLGPIRRVTGSARISFPTRTITSQPKAGQEIIVEVPTHINGILDFHNGASGTLITSFDVAAHTMPSIQIYGSQGTLAVPDPNNFSGTVQIKRIGATDWEDIPVTRPYAENSRGIGVADMAYALRSGRPHRASGDLTFHVLDAMHGFHDSSDTGTHYVLPSTVARPAALPANLAPGTLDE